MNRIRVKAQILELSEKKIVVQTVALIGGEALITIDAGHQSLEQAMMLGEDVIVEVKS